MYFHLQRVFVKTLLILSLKENNDLKIPEYCKNTLKFKGVTAELHKCHRRTFYEVTAELS